MDVIFKNRRLEKACTVDRQAMRLWTPHRAKLLRRRLDDLRAAENLGVMRLLPGHCHELRKIRKYHLTLHLDGLYRLVFEPAEDPIPLKDDGGLDWNGVKAIRVLAIEDTHD